MADLSGEMSEKEREEFEENRLKIQSLWSRKGKKSNEKGKGKETNRKERGRGDVFDSRVLLRTLLQG